MANVITKDGKAMGDDKAMAHDKAMANDKAWGKTRELPAPGYPVAEEAVEYWFRNRYGHAPTEQELGAIIGEMAQRESTQPQSGSSAAASGWVVGPPAPATRR